MANDSKQYQEEEYLFSEDEHADPLNPSDQSTQIPDEVTSEKGSFWMMWRKNIMIGGILLVVVFIAYKIISAFFVSTEVKQIPEIPTQSSSKINTALPVSATANQNSANTTSLHDAVNFYNQNRKETQQLEQLEATSQSIGTEITNLQNTTQSLQSSVDNINTQLSQLNTALTALTNQMQTQENRWIQSQKRIKPRIVPKKPIVLQSTYQTLALVPGRAWLKSSKGATITVSEGSEIPGYGTVTRIDVPSGRIVTSSGRIIAYAANDQ